MQHVKLSLKTPERATELTAEKSLRIRATWRRIVSDSAVFALPNYSVGWIRDVNDSVRAVRTRRYTKI